jgi:hypothetical protein
VPKIFTPEGIVRYADTRLSDEDLPVSEMTAVFQHNGVLPSFLEKELAEGGGYRRMIQPNGREPMYSRGSEVHFPQFSGFGRDYRYKRMIEEYAKVCGRDMAFHRLDAEGNPRRTSANYDNFSYDFTKTLFGKGLLGGRAREVRKVIFGPLKAVAEQVPVIERAENEYLDAQIVRVGAEQALNLGYVYADQAGILLDKLLVEYDSIAKKEGTPLELGVYMFGRVGGLGERMRINDLVRPTGIIDDIDLRAGRAFVYPMHNVLADLGSPSLVLNVASPLDETTEQLEGAKDCGCSCVEMESRESVEAINKARRRYRDLAIDFGFVGYVSDLPLQGSTLADELPDAKGARDAVALILNHLGERSRVSSP